MVHSYVIAEFVALADRRGLPRIAALIVAYELLHDEAIEVIWVDERLHLAALDMLQRQTDKRYSLCVAVSFVIMAEHKMSESLTTDHHFEQAGFRGYSRDRPTDTFSTAQTQI